MRTMASQITGELVSFSKAGIYIIYDVNENTKVAHKWVYCKENILVNSIYKGSEMGKTLHVLYALPVSMSPLTVALVVPNPMRNKHGIRPVIRFGTIRSTVREKPVRLKTMSIAATPTTNILGMVCRWRNFATATTTIAFPRTMADEIMK